MFVLPECLITVLKSSPYLNCSYRETCLFKDRCQQTVVRQKKKCYLCAYLLIKKEKEAAESRPSCPGSPLG